MPQTYKLALLDDYQKVAMRMADWDRLKKRGVEITVFHDAFKSVEDAAQKLAPFDMLCLLRERTAFPKALMDEIYAWCEINAADERKAGQAEDQFLYSTRKKAIGPFKRALWDLETKDEVLASQGAKMAFLFDQLKVPGTADLVGKYVQPVLLSRPIPEALKAAVAG